MRNKYHVNYLAENEEKTFNVIAHNKQEAYNIFRNVVSRTYIVTDIIDYTQVLKQKKLMRKIISYAVAALIIVASIIASVIVINTTWKHPEPKYYETYVVEKGDCLWNIADDSDGWNKLNNRKIIEDLCNESNCSSMIYPGQVVYIPMYDID